MLHGPRVICAQLGGAPSLPSASRGFWDLNSGHQAWVHRRHLYLLSHPKPHSLNCLRILASPIALKIMDKAVSDKAQQ